MDSTSFMNHQGLSPEEIEVLRERSASLAIATRLTADNDLQQTSMSYLTVEYLDERYGIPLDLTSEVIAVSDVVPVPGAPRHVMGLTRLRGQILALVNLRCFWRGGVFGQVDCDLAVVINVNDVSFGLLCNRVEGLKLLTSDTIEPVSRDLPEIVQNTISGIADRNIILVDPQRLIHSHGFMVK